MVRVLARPQGREPPPTSQALPGALQADAYAGFQRLYEAGSIVGVTFWADTQRKFHEIHLAHASPITTEAIERIAGLYAVEAEIRGCTPEIRKTVRQARAGPLLDSMRLWLDAALAWLSTRSDTAVAILYARSRWPALTRYARDGHLDIDNNIAERALRFVTLGRKNFLFCGSEAGGDRAARIYSLLGSAKLNGLDPELYLHLILGRIADHAISRVKDLLLWNGAMPNLLRQS
jgi:transposase